MKEVRVRVGLAGAVHPNMPGDDAGLYAATAGRMAALAAELGFDLSVYREPLRSEEDGEKARAFMDGERSTSRCCSTPACRSGG